MWWLWGAVTALLGTGLGFAIGARDDNAASWRGSARAWFLPGPTSHGHYQIELACDSCHGEAFAGKEVMQDACVKCHAAELKEARDSHPKSKFTDPRNAERAARLDATRCVTCHVEHRPRIAHAAGDTLPTDFCAICHDDIGKERPTHRGLAFGSCANAGCHNFHDNRALYDEFLLKHAGQAPTLAKALLPARDFRSVIEELGDYPIERFPLRPLDASDADGRGGEKVRRDWLETAHARGGVPCSGCHRQDDSAGRAAWVDKPGPEACKACHGAELSGWSAGRHGMRHAAGLPPMRTEQARLPMTNTSHGKDMNCVSCHAAHRFDTAAAAVDACLGCHADEHSAAYRRSPHYRLWQQERSGAAPAGSGVSCASCHMPRVEHRGGDDVKRILVQHNQNDTLRPNDKMLRPVCLNCHGLQFSLDALADRGLIARNFAGMPAHSVDSIAMAQEVEAKAEQSRAAARPREERDR